MIAGRVNSDLEAAVEIRLQDIRGDFHSFQCVIDSGFTGFLTLPTEVIQLLDLVPRGNRQITLVSGTVVMMPVYLAVVDWRGELLEVTVLQTEQELLVGMAFLETSTLTVQVWDGGEVLIESR
jgi:clan AA aspartic protease